jgi:hypothetical protein
MNRTVRFGYHRVTVWSKPEGWRVNAAGSHAVG